jgi:hypothetical protein
MDINTYDFLYDNLKSPDDVYFLAQANPNVRLETLNAIYFQKQLQYTRKTIHQFRKSDQVAYYYARYQKGEGLVEIARDIGLSPSLLAPLIVQAYLIYENYYIDTTTNKLCAYPKHLATPEPSRSTIAHLVRNPEQISDLRLRHEIARCIQHDDIYSPLSEKIRHTLGEEMELRLSEKLHCLGVPFRTEQELRKEGYPKTPDIYLQVPFVVDGHVVNWIESKASFGDLQSHKEYMEKQYCGYVKRFGPGLVIYWAGYLNELCHHSSNIIIRDHFPENIAFLSGSQT